MSKNPTLIFLLAIAALVMGACAPAATANPDTTSIPTAVEAYAISTPGTPSGTTMPAAPPAAPSGTTMPSAPPAAPSGAAMPPAPPAGGTGGPPPGGGGSSDVGTGLATATGAYTLDGGSETQTDQTCTASKEDESGVYVTNGATLILNNPTITTSGNTSSDDNSSFYGLNAGVLATSGSAVRIAGGTITTTGTGANGAFATESGSSVHLSQVTITASGDGAHGVMATLGGTVTLDDVDITTSGAHAAAIATDRGGGTITVTGGKVETSGQDSPGIYSTGAISVSGAIISATGSEAAVIEGANTITLTNTALSSSMQDKWGVMIYQSMSGDAEGTKGVFTMAGGSLAYTASNGPLFYVTNSTGIVTLKGVNATVASGTLVAAAGNDRWGTSGSNGGTVLLTADGQTLTGDMVADSISSITAMLQNGSSLTGAINSAHTAKEVNLSLDESSSWNVTAESYLTCLTDTAGISGAAVTNITGNGHTVYYDASACPALAGQTYSLSGGGTLTPAN